MVEGKRKVREKRRWREQKIKTNDTRGEDERKEKKKK